MADRGTDVMAGLEDTSGIAINPATEDKQDDIIAILGGISSSDIEGGGKISVGTTAVEATFTGTTETITITAHIDNSGVLYVGKSNVTNLGANAAYVLWAGMSVTLDYNDDTNAVYVVSDTASQNFIKGATL